MTFAPARLASRLHPWAVGPMAFPRRIPHNDGAAFSRCRMSQPPPRSGRPAQGRWLAILASALLVAGGSAGFIYLQRRPSVQPPPPVPFDPPAGDIKEQVHHFCGGCHAYPPPHTFPKQHWQHEVEVGYQFFSGAGKNLRPPRIDDVVKYYVERAPETLPPIQAEAAANALPVRFERIDVPGPPLPLPYAISHVSIVRLSDRARPDLLACDMRNGVVIAWQPYADKPAWKVLGKVANPAHAEVVDLDGDGVLDILVANLGNFSPVDIRCGSVVWLRGRPDGTYAPAPLLEDVGRVADVQAADFRGTGQLDLVVASFGWNKIGSLLYLENRTEDWSKPKFVPRELDERHGAVHVPVVDLNADGKPDFVTLFAQEHETIVAFLNEGHGKFRKETIFPGPHPAYGSSGIQMVDMNSDGRLDVLYTNGDTLDAPFLLKPYHGVQWLENPGLENPGDGTFPWKHHAIAPLYGAHRAVAADLCGTGRMDVLAVSFLPPEHFPERHKHSLDSIVLFERSGAGRTGPARTGPGTFARHSLAKTTCDHVSCAVGDVYGTGRQDLVTGLFANSQSEHVVTIWKNLGAGRK